MKSNLVKALALILIMAFSFSTVFGEANNYKTLENNHVKGEVSNSREEITSYEDFKNMKSDGQYIISKDIIFSGEIESIGSEEQPFNGSLEMENGAKIILKDDFSIKPIRIKEGSTAGIFGVIGENGVLLNVTIEGDLNVKYMGPKSFTGGLVGVNNGSIENSNFIGDINVKQILGHAHIDLVGINKGEIKNSFHKGEKYLNDKLSKVDNEILDQGKKNNINLSEKDSSIEEPLKENVIENKKENISTSQENVLSKENTISKGKVTTATRKKRILLISGHGGIDPGAMSNGYTEANLNRQVTSSVKKKLDAMGADADVYPPARDCYVDARTGNLQVNFTDYDYILEVHFNAYNRSRHGTEVLYPSSLKTIDTSLLNSVGAYIGKRATIQRTDLLVIKTAKNKGVPVSLLEVCYLDNANDMKLYQAKKEEIHTSIAKTVYNTSNYGKTYKKSTSVKRSITTKKYKYKVEVKGGLVERKGAGTEYAKTGRSYNRGKVLQGYVVTIGSERWLKLSTGRFVCIYKGATYMKKVSTTVRYKTNTTLKVRKGPGTNYSGTGTVYKKGTILRGTIVNKKNERWLKLSKGRYVCVFKNKTVYMKRI